MDRKNLGRFYADNIGLVHTVARRSYGRLMAIGAVTDYDDLFQELSEVFVKAYDRFDESLGNKFSTYFMSAAFNELNRRAKVFEIERVELGIRSIEEMNSWRQEEGGLEDVIPSHDSTPEQIACAREGVSNLINGLSPLASALASMTLDPPDFIEREFRATVGHAEYSRSIGIEKRARSAINISFVCSVLEKTTALSYGALKEARMEVETFAKENFCD